ncbi:MAG: DUF4179 domain-containing protein [Clostridia bacterium]|nr:DUF4179 domain-containing protein [Clostridia bacterium]
MKEKIKNGTLTHKDVRALIDWQLTLREEQIDSPLLAECLMMLYPEDCVLGSEEKAQLWERIKEAAFGASRVQRRKNQPHRRRYFTKTILIALMITLLLAGVAIAAMLGLFGYFMNDPMIETSHQRLEYLDEVAVNVGVTQQVVTPSGNLADIDLTTDYGKILAQQYGRELELTVDQVYCDGNKLYYSYRISEPQRTFELFEGVLTGFESWDWEEPGKKVADTYCMPGTTDEERAKAEEWFAAHERAYAIQSYFGIGDGASLDDGSERGLSLMIFDSGMEEPDPYHEIGFQQVDLPEDYVPGDTISFFIDVLYGAEIVCQDENGTYRTTINNPENRGFIPVRFTATVTGKPEKFETTVTFDEYTARVELAISDVDISGMAYVDAPQDWFDAFDADDWEGADSIYDYELVADGQRMRNLFGGWGYSKWTNQWQVYLRYDLPISTNSLTLVPKRTVTGWREDESIVIK